jgi:hypothetical protein
MLLKNSYLTCSLCTLQPAAAAIPAAAAGRRKSIKKKVSLPETV